MADLARRDPYFLGSHLEGPYLAVERKGAHDPKHLIYPTPDDIRDIIRAAEERSSRSRLTRQEGMPSVRLKLSLGPESR